MATGPLVSIGCAVYNGEKTLARALTPLVEQDYENLEIIISDDGSKDGSREIFESFARKDPRVRILPFERNVGVTENFNRLAREARGKYFMWADQDDIRDRTFVSKTLAPLEADDEAVVCHSHSGVFVGDPNDIKLIVTLYGVDNVSSLVRRYYRFLNYYSDTTISGLIRTDALRKTKLWRNDLGAGNALLFELLLLGKFLEVPEVLYFYSGRGMRNRPDVSEEYARVNPGKTKPFYYFPFLILARNQMVDIMKSRATITEKLELGSFLWGHTATIAATKLIYRSLMPVLGDNIPESFTNLCDNVVEPKKHLVFLNGSENDDELFPKAWILKGGE
jgi:glycosyltransferase involved in cell wall biosynthesis